MSAPVIRLLIVDDHPVVRDGLTGMFSGEPGIEVLGEAANGAEAVARAEALRPDVILMDLRMPEMDGVMLQRALSERAPGVPVIIMTGHRDSDTAAEARKAGAVETMVLLKPFDDDYLLSLLQSIVG